MKKSSSLSSSDECRTSCCRPSHQTNQLKTRLGLWAAIFHPHIGVARIFPAGVHSIFTSKPDDLFSHHPRYTGDPPKLTTRTLSRPIKIRHLALPGVGGCMHLQLPLQIKPNKFFSSRPWGRGVLAPAAYASASHRRYLHRSVYIKRLLHVK